MLFCHKNLAAKFLPQKYVRSNFASSDWDRACSILKLLHLRSSSHFLQDLVKLLLKNSVKNEFDKYQEKIIYLEELAAKLRSENDSLRPHVDQHVLLQYQQQQQQTQVYLMCFCHL